MQPSHASGLAALRQRQRAALYAIFFVSGFCGLIYESIWSHYLKLLLGHAAYAQAVVLVVFVGGLALGAWLTGRVTERVRQPLLWYALIEAGVAVAAFAFQGVFERVSFWASTHWLPASCGAPGPCSAAWWIAAGLILPPAVLLGTTFPLMSAGVIRLGAAPGRGLSLLYFLNSAGAAIGVLASGFILIPAIGLPGTLLVAGSLNAFVALAAYATVRPFSAGSAAPAAPMVQPWGRRADLPLLLWVAGLTGLSSFIYEVVWIRMLTLVLGAATHAFELMLAPFILGLALGAWWIRNRIEAAADTLLLLARIQVVMGLLAVATLPLYAGSFDAMAWALKALARGDESYTLFNIASMALAAMVMLPATICAGMTLPLITAALLRLGHGERQVGQVYGINTFGAIAGVLLAVHWLIPQLGLKVSLAMGAAVDVLLGLVLWLVALRRAGRRVPGLQSIPLARAPRRTVFAAVAIASLALLVALPWTTELEARRLASGVFRMGEARVDDQHKVLFHRDGKTATVTVLERRNGVRSLLTNGKSDGATHPQARLDTLDDHTMVLLGALGPAHHPKAKTAAVIGLGTGTSSSVLLASPQLQQVDTIEIEPMMVEAAQLFRPRNAPVFEDRRSHIVIDDARAHFSRSATRYDLVVSEPSNPWVSGVSGLFTVEFYAHVADHLADDGHFVQWLHLYESSPQQVGSILRAFTMVFPQFRAYATNHADLVLVARNDGQLPELRPGALDTMPRMQQHLLQIGITSEALLAAHDMGRANAIKLLANSYPSPVNSDYHPYVDHRAAHDRFRGQLAADTFQLRLAPVPVLEFAGGPGPYAGAVESATELMPLQVRALAAGRQGLRYLQGERLQPDQMWLLGADTVQYAAVRSWAADCRFPAETGSAWSALVVVASGVNRGAAPDAASAYWKSLGTRCGARLGDAQRAWIALFGAVAARDGDATSRHADRVLALDTQLPPISRAYATLASVAGHQSAARRAQAAEVMKAQARLLPADMLDAPWFRYLVWSMRVAPVQP